MREWLDLVFRRLHLVARTTKLTNLKTEVSVVLVLLLVIASAGVGYFVGTTNQRTVTLIPSSSSVSGLELRVSLNSTRFSPNEKLGINISLYNSLSSPFNLSVSNDWKVLGFPVAIWSPCLYSEPVEFMIVKGNLSLAQLQIASVNSSTSGGFCMEGGSVTHLLFQPNSNTAELEGSYCIANCSPYRSTVKLISNFTVNGYWIYPMNATEANDVYTPIDGGVSFQYPEVGPVRALGFASGMYTFVAADEWGQTDIVHFLIV
jgi:hypothetical protein